MIASSSVDPVRDEETLARFVLHESRVRADGTIRADEFMPPRTLELSVSRHGVTDERQLWERGSVVAAVRNLKVVGRADIVAAAVRTVRPLDVLPAPLPEDLQHAHIIGWPAGPKEAQKALAQALSISATFVRAPG